MLGGNEPLASALTGPLGRADVAGIGKHRLLLAVQQFAHFHHVRNVGWRRGYRVHQAAFDIDTNVRLHAEVPLISFARLVHLRVARLVLVLRRRWRVDDRRIEDRALLQEQAMVRQMCIDCR